MIRRTQQTNSRVAVSQRKKSASLPPKMNYTPLEIGVYRNWTCSSHRDGYKCMARIPITQPKG
jgi:hypothetical protein